MKKESAKLISEVISQFVEENGLEQGLLRVRIFEAWNLVIGENASKAVDTLFYRDKKLHCRLNSAVIRSQLFMNKKRFITKINELLAEDVLDDIILQ